MIYFLSLLSSYFIGSIPFGLILARMWGIKDLRSHGSNNIGATNALRVGGKSLGILTLLCDIIKGLIPILITKYLFPDNTWLIALVCVVVVIGHVYPVWLNFKGGKGVATTIAVLYCINIYLGLSASLVWIAVYKKSKISSLSSLCMMIWTLIISSFFLNITYIMTVTILTVIIFIRHKSNIQRLKRGEEKAFKS